MSFLIRELSVMLSIKIGILKNVAQRLMSTQNKLAKSAGKNLFLLAFFLILGYNIRIRKQIKQSY